LHKRTEIERERIISEEAGAWSEEVVVADSGRERERERERESGFFRNGGEIASSKLNFPRSPHGVL
jgi:hypothetical protein